jgi:hypothetical protein
LLGGQFVPAVLFGFQSYYLLHAVDLQTNDLGGGSPKTKSHSAVVQHFGSSGERVYAGFLMQLRGKSPHIAVYA